MDLAGKNGEFAAVTVSHGRVPLYVHIHVINVEQ